MAQVWRVATIWFAVPCPSTRSLLDVISTYSRGVRFVFPLNRQQRRDLCLPAKAFRSRQRGTLVAPSMTSVNLSSAGMMRVGPLWGSTEFRVA
ncbi:hypothetical protein DFH08DRAFT_838409 [Mycena albidolilacea]|uniref:Uncharacterized protein n=1 Tax=Mycena albidolilacea TaxID=1033008 RepID=A0AAD7ANJ1_9AGAR|nr:hypothetical protein DFH08DRAFT_838409 [Mycena albidolilacea]